MKRLLWGLGSIVGWAILAGVAYAEHREAKNR